jgi:hypothetical protein
MAPVREDDGKCDASGGSVLSVTVSQVSQPSQAGDGCDGCDAVTDKNIPRDASLRPPDQTSLSEIPSDNNGTPEKSLMFPDVEWFPTGICSSCGVHNQTTMHEGKQLCKLCYFELKSDELAEGENIDGSINPSNDNQKQELIE